MKIKKIEICGFKSFVDKTTLVFDHDVTCVVGPNGCGKSNIVDAIRWAMGEQSAKNLRGRGMEDVIFNGSESRGPHGMAEVTLTFDNTGGAAPAEYRDYAEISVTRRLYRGGESDYLINKTPVRLMDVTNFFLGTGVGKRAYSIIEQGRIGFIVSAKPEDRRYLIEEAAGITKFKARKKAAEKKIEQTRQNLLRVSDIVAEIEKNLASLRRQAQKAERYREYRHEMKDLELTVASQQFFEWTAKHKMVRAQLEQRHTEAEALRHSYGTSEAELEAERVRMEEVVGTLERLQTRAYELDNELKLAQNQIDNAAQRLNDLAQSERVALRDIEEVERQRTELQRECEEIAHAVEPMKEAAEREAARLLEVNDEYERRKREADEASVSVSSARAHVNEAGVRVARMEAILEGFERRKDENRKRATSLEQEKENLRARGENLEEEIAAVLARMEGLRSGKEQTAATQTELQQSLERLREQIRGSDVRVETLRTQLGDARSRLRSLEDIHQKFEGVGAGVRAVMKHVKSPEIAQAGVLGLVADRIDCPHEYSQALAASLSHELQHVVIRETASAAEVVRFLTQKQLGRATFVPQSPRRDGRDGRDGRADADRESVASVLAHDAEVVGCLVDLVSYSPEDQALVRHLLDDVWVVESLGAATRLYEQGVNVLMFVTRDGDVVRRDGSVSGGRGEDVGAHRLEMKREMKDLHEKIARLDDELTQAVHHHKELRTQIADHQARLDAARSGAHEAELAVVQAQGELARKQEERKRSDERQSRLLQEIESLRNTLSVADGEEVAARDEIAEAQRQKSDGQAVLAERETELAAKIESAEAQAKVVTEVRVRAAEAKQRLQHAEMTLHRLTRSLVELGAREERLRGDVEQAREQQREIQTTMEQRRSEMSDNAQRAMAAQQEVAQARAAYDAEKERLSARELQLRDMRASLDSINADLTQLSVQDKEIESGLRHLIAQVEERHRVDLARVVGDYHLRDIADDVVLRRIDELKRLIERMGEINLLAIEEFEEQSKRYEYLQGQKVDLEQALEQLDKAIRQMNRESKRLFAETFDAINSGFQRVFPRMFGGGRGELRLTNPDDLLESGVEIVAQPPGKRLGAIELMSGGEKALTAVSLIFAIFQFKPSPFCLLDEVDAPLDEANVGRFSDAIREMTAHSQFIVISHSKRTMESADVLYGVTMETPGISKIVSVELKRELHKARGRDSRLAHEPVVTA
jgi:chromosome segregation protein